MRNNVIAIIAVIGVINTLALSVYGIFLVLLFLVFQAPDVALSELVIGGVGFPFILLAALAKVRGPRKPRDEDEG